MRAPSIPTRPLGVVADDYGTGWSTLLYNALEHVPELQPGYLATVEYAQMRRDPNLAAILAGYTLQLRRAQWQVDGRGCRPEVTTAVAEDLGLNVAGSDETGAARTRGVSWSEHLRSALLMLTYGYMASELVAEVGDGRARLVSLADRMPHTIEHVHADAKTGDLLGITQSGTRRGDQPQIRADRLAFYVNEREGANWYGTSLLRPAHGYWRIKREMVLTHAISNRRWGAGVPVAQARPGTAPSGAQMAEAQRMASAARAGDQAGAAMPPDFDLVIQGLSGAVPDTLAFIEWIDRCATRAALMGHLELGQGGNGGSRALGSTFVDSLMLALESVAESVADTATRHIAARLVSWNWGESEPVPRVVVAGVGSRRETTAESLQALLASGGLSADPALEAWIRREWRLPEREGMAQPGVTALGVDIPKPADGEEGDDWGLLDDEPPAKPVKAARRGAGNPDQMSLFGDERQVHAAVRETPEQIQSQWEAARTELLAAWPATAAPLVAELAAQAEAAVADRDLPRLGQLAASAGVIAAQAATLGKGGSRLARQAADGVVAAAAAHDVTVKPGVAGADTVRQTAEAVAHIIAAGYASGAGRIALQHAGADPQSVRAAVEQHLDGLSTAQRGMVADQLGALLSAAQHAGRLSVLERAPKGTTFRASENNDDPNRCEECEAANGRRYKTLRAALVDYPSAGLKSCRGMSRCRGFIAADWPGTRSA